MHRPTQRTSPPDSSHKPDFADAHPKPAVRDPLTPPASDDSALARADLSVTRRFVVLTVIATVVVAGGVEWAGWQAAYRNAGPLTQLPAADAFGVPLSQWGIGVARNFVGAVGVGLGFAGVAALWPPARRRPWRALAVAFALGAALFLGGLAALTAWAP